LIKLVSSLMPAPSADRPLSEICVLLFKIIVLKNSPAPFAEQYTTDVKKQNVTKKSSSKMPQELRKMVSYFGINNNN
jgi:hypothetical protein